MNDESAPDDLTRVSLLAEPTRRRLYEFVMARGEAVGRDEAAAAAGVSRHLAAFHLDRLASAGLLSVEFKRLSGRRGRGAGRPSKLYRAAGTVAVSVPPTRYDLAASILAEALSQTGRTAVRRAAGARGRSLGRELAGRTVGDGPERVAAALSLLGFHAGVDPDGSVHLRNCPFDSVARERPELICDLNRALLDGFLDGLGEAEMRARIETPDACCMRLA